MDEKLPDFLQEYFWDTDYSQITWDLQRDFIIRRVCQPEDKKSANPDSKMSAEPE
jgi:hypothetical protein